MAVTLRLYWAGLLLAVPAWQLSTAWAGPVPAVLLPATAVAALAAVAIGARLRLPGPLVPAALVLGCLVLAYRVAGEVAGRAGGRTVDALRDTLPRLLTERRPAPATLELLLPGVLFVVLVAVWVAQRTMPEHRRGAGLVAAPVGAVAIYAAAALLTAGTADPYGVGAGLIALLAATGWVVMDTVRPRAPACLRATAPAAAVAASVVLGVGLVSLGTGFEPRHLVDPPMRTVVEPSPLLRVAAWQQQGDVELLRARLDPDVRLRLVVLADYTGATWSGTATYRRPGTAPRYALPPGRHQETVSARLLIAGLAVRWLPTPGHAVAVSLPDVDVEPETGSLALRGGVAGPGLDYTVSAVVDTPPVDEVAVAGVPTGPAAQRYLALPRLPWSLAEYARRFTFGATTPFEQAVAIEYAVRNGRRHDANAPAGSSYARLETFLFRDPGSEPGAGAGTSAQFAGAFAVLARSVGLPTRVVVGFTPGAAAPDGSRVVRGRDARAWAEVYFDGLGWYGFDPAPVGAAGPAGPDERLKLAALDRMGVQVAQVGPIEARTVPPSLTPATTPPPQAAKSRPGSGPPLGGMAGVAAGGAAAVVLALLTGRWLRRIRHRRAGDRGAWSEVLDLLVLMGQPPPRWRPAPEVAAYLAALAPEIGQAGRNVAPPGAWAHPAAVIADAADRAAFAPDAVAGGDGWSALTRVRRAARAAVPLRRRLTWPVDPRPLFRRHGKPTGST